jgi:4'-phosphopantetheinyl transferase
MTVSVSLWSADFATFPEHVDRLEAGLAAGERARLARFAEPGLRRRFLLRRTMLRTLLARATGKTPQFVYGPQGKPAPADPAAPRFSVAHAGDFSVVALSNDREIGVDVARFETLDDLDAVVARTFGPLERASFAALPDALKLEAFYAVWTQKEALLKGLGLGLSVEPDRIAVRVDPREQPRLEGTPPEHGGIRDWQFARLSLASPYRGTLAYEEPQDAVEIGYREFGAHLLPG